MSIARAERGAVGVVERRSEMDSASNESERVNLLRDAAATAVGRCADLETSGAVVKWMEAPPPSPLILYDPSGFRTSSYVEVVTSSMVGNR